jgi:hypothetical protein
MSTVTDATNVFAKSVTLPGRSKVNQAAAILCRLWLCAVLGGSASKLSGHCCILDINMVTKQTTCMVQGATSQMTIILTPVYIECLVHSV